MGDHHSKLSCVFTALCVIPTGLQLPFRDFFLVNRGYMQDNQMSFPSQSVYTFGLVLADRVNGPFHLEIQCIRVGYSLIHTSDLVSKPMSSNTFRL